MTFRRIGPIWYDLFSLFYDRALEDLYAPFRPAAVRALRLEKGARLLDIPCGTGQSLGLLVDAAGPNGVVVGVDYSSGMLRKAQRRAKNAGWKNVHMIRSRAADVDSEMLSERTGHRTVDGVLCALGLTALPEWEATFDQLYSLVRPGGQIVLFDVYASERTRETASVEVVARADLSRQVWLPLAERCPDFTREVLPADPKKFGGELYVAAGTVPS